MNFRWKLSYQNEQEYEVFGHPTVTRIEAYSDATAFGLLDYQKKTCNYTSEEFERIMVARQNGVIIRHVDAPYTTTEAYWAARRWTPELYNAFVKHLTDAHAEYLAEHERRRIARGWTLEEYPIQEMRPIPRPIYYDADTKGYLTEPWF